MGESRFKSNAF